MSLEFSSSIVRRLSVLFQGIFRIFLFINGIMIGISVLNVIQSSSLHFRTHFWIFFILMVQFWMMVLIFFLLSVGLKVCLYVASGQTGEENIEWMQALMLFPLREEGEEEIYQMMVQESMHTSAPPARNAPTMDKLLKMDLDWGSHVRPLLQLSDAQKEEKCLICLQAMDHVMPTPSIQGVVHLTCTCNTLFHKKCILEWFHFNEKDAQGEEPRQVTCPSCRHVFTAT